MKKGFFVLLLAIGYWLLAIGLVALAEENKNCNKEVAKTYIRLKDGSFVEISNIHSLTCPKPVAKTKLTINISFTEKEKKRAAEIMPLVTKLAKMPGDCKTIEECEAYCFADVENLKECLGFAEKYKILSSNELGEAKTMVNVLAGVKEKKSGGFRPPTCLPGTGTECL